MHAAIESKRSEIEALCRQLGVRRLDLFGSATGDAFDVNTSDVDVITAASVRNPYFRARVEQTKETLYAA